MSLVSKSPTPTRPPRYSRGPILNARVVIVVVVVVQRGFETSFKPEVVAPLPFLLARALPTGQACRAHHAQDPRSSVLGREVLPAMKPPHNDSDTSPVNPPGHQLNNTLNAAIPLRPGIGAITQPTIDVREKETRRVV
ncbi:hypothetical protein SAMD00023353_6100150 [Rosellinia necatrix]|uniref:Uncharacterized protein n=1 Tax=Rosellinia necatrix TaxID=77044 RepID=A0A1S8AAA8_ROSNE|nr:hypothetical protein SAMD00023353_6100150 [Rosellinia necatrix]